MKHLKGYSIAFAGLIDGTHAFDFSVNKKFLEHFEGALISDADVKVQVTLEKRLGFMSLHLQLEGTVKTTCDVCLELFDLPIKGSEQIAIKIVEQIPPDAENDIDVIYLERGTSTLHLSKVIYELLSLSLPMRIAHPDNENGQPTCNPDVLKFLQPPVEDTTPEESPVEGENNIWSTLKNLK